MTFLPLGSTRTLGTDSTGPDSTEDGAGPRNTTGAKLITAEFSGAAANTATLTDSVGNTYPSILLVTGSEQRIRFFYCIDPITSPTHNWQVNGTSLFGVLHVAYWGNDSTVVGVDVTNSASGSGSTRATGAVTPGYSKSLLMACAASSGNSGVFSINGGFTIAANNQSPGVDSVAYSGAMAYPIQDAIATANPTWTMPVSSNHAAGIIVFRGGDGVAGGGDTTPPTLSSPSGTGGLGVCSGSVSTNEAVGDLYAVATASATAPTALQVRNGQDHTGAAALRVRSQAVSATGVQSIPSGAISGGAGTRYWHFMHEDAAGNRSAVVSSSGFEITATATQLVLSVPDAAGLSNFNGIVLSASAPGAGVTVIATPTGITFNGSGQATISASGLGIPVGARRWVSVSNSTGDPAQSPAPVQAQGPVTAS